ncbi:hypothetical protein ACF1A9_08410 [Streptomyces sp. NPDC014872]|uniref:hypothetical protein n=1 Tax=Streptomyces sp. NPDC014872 TaxID=3364926 RepID=UPI003701B134
MKRIRAAVVTAAVIAGTALAAPAHALSHCTFGTGTIIRDYGVAGIFTARGIQTECAIGTGLAAYVRTKTSSSCWSNWSSLGGQWQSGITLLLDEFGNVEFSIVATGGDGRKGINDYAWDDTRTGRHHRTA